MALEGDEFYRLKHTRVQSGWRKFYRKIRGTVIFKRVVLLDVVPADKELRMLSRFRLIVAGALCHVIIQFHTRAAHQLGQYFGYSWATTRRLDYDIACVD